MSRETQLIGLKPEALDFLHQHGYERAETPYASAKEEGMFDDGPELYLWHKASDEKHMEDLLEIVQCAPWSSGPCIFLCLEAWYHIRKFQWSEEEIDKAM